MFTKKVKVKVETRGRKNSENPANKTINMRVTENTRSLMDKMAEKEGISRSALLKNCFEFYKTHKNDVSVKTKGQ